MKFSLWRRWLRELGHGFILADRPRSGRSRRQVRPVLEVLEDRTAPAVFTVNLLGDAGNGSGNAGDLAYCIAQSNSNPGGNTINFSLPSGPQTINLSSQLTIDQSVTIDAGPAQVTISGDDVTRVFMIQGNCSVMLNNLTIANGYANFGGGVYNSASLKVTACTFTGNEAYGGDGGSPDQSSGGAGGGGAGLGGAIYNAGLLTVTNATLVNNVAIGGNGGSIDGNYPNVNAGQGGGSNGGAPGVGSTSSSGTDGAAGGFGGGGGGGGGAYGSYNSPASGNGGDGGFGAGAGGAGGSPFGGGGANPGTPGMFAGNGGSGYSSGSGGGGGGAGLGGAIFTESGTVYLYFCTITDNAANGGLGGGSYAPTSGGQGLGGGLFVDGGTLSMTDSIVSGDSSSTSCPDIYGPTSGGSNLVGTSADLGPLQYHGGPTDTLAPAPNSPVIGGGTLIATIMTDQRGQPRLGWTNIGAYQDSFQVTNTADAGAGSLRQVILNSNSFNADVTITFNVMTEEVATIQPQSPLPTITNAVLIDGFSQPGAVPGSPLIELNGSQAGPSDGLTITAGNSTIEGLIIDGFDGSGIVLTGNGSIGDVVSQNIIGTGYQGASNTGDGIDITNGASGTIVGGNAGLGNNISGNYGSGIVIGGMSAAGPDNEILGNQIGTDLSGNLPLGNGMDGVVIDAGSSGESIGEIGVQDGNIISANSGVGILLQDTSNDIVLANMIGVGSDSVTPLGNQGGGIVLTDTSIQTSDNTIGSVTNPNIICRNGGYGLTLSGSLVADNFVSGNLIGTNSITTSHLGNMVGGIDISDGASGNVIGGGNIIFGNPAGVVLEDATTLDNVITSNTIVATAAPAIVSSAAPTTAVPVLTGVSSSPNGTGSTLTGYVTGSPGDVIQVELFANPVAGPPYQGSEYLSYLTVTIGSSGVGSFSFNGPQLRSTDTFTATATDTSASDNTSLFSNAPPAKIVAIAGSGQQTYASQPFANPLTVSVYDAFGNALSGIPVFFTAPVGYVFFAGNAITNAVGQATVFATAGLVAGTYQVIATVGGVASSPFTLTNVLPGAPVVQIGTSALSNVGSPFNQNGYFTDILGGPFDATANYNDGSATQSLALSGGTTFVLTHNYGTEGTYYVSVQVTDLFGQTGTATLRVDVFLAGINLANVQQDSAPPGGSISVSSIGVTANLHRSANDTGIGLLLVTSVPATVAVHLATIPAPIGQSYVTLAYDIRSINLSGEDVGSIVFAFASNASNKPVLEYYNAAAGKYLPVVASQLQPDSFIVNATAHTITVVLDDSSSPQLDTLIGTVFTVTVAVPTTATGDTSASLVFAAAANLSGNNLGEANGLEALASTLSTALLGTAETESAASGGGDGPNDDSSSGYSSRLLRYLPIVLGSGPSVLDDRPTLILSPSQATLPDPAEAPLPDLSGKPLSLRPTPAGALNPSDQVFADAELRGGFGFALDFLDNHDDSRDPVWADPVAGGVKGYPE